MQDFTLLLGIVIAEWIVLYPRMTGSSGYLGLALRRTSGFLLSAVAARWAVGWAFLQLMRLSDLELFRSWVWGGVVGLIVVIFPSSLEHFLDKRATTKFVSSTLIQLLLRFNLLIGQTIKGAVQKLKEQDNYDCQNSKGSWNFGLPVSQVNRRLRILYEIVKLDIACKKRQSELLRHDVNIPSGQKFYLLVAHMGRKKLRIALQEPPPPPPPGFDWDGQERRRRVGSKADRKTPDPNPSHSRVYDNIELREKISRGEAIDSTTDTVEDLTP